MKIQRIEVEKIRGIKKLSLEPNGENIVIFGPNGSGKSAVIDAIDFLLTGKISRLEGEGTRELSTKRHGPHIDHELKEAIVKAEVKITDVKEDIIIERKMDDRELLVENKYKDLISSLLGLANLGQHLLSRREILRYILAPAGDRAEKIYSIVNLAKIEKSRKINIAVKGIAEREYENSKNNLERVKNDINVVLGLKEFNEKECLLRINKYRSMLKGEILENLEYINIKKGINRPAGRSEEDVRDLKTLKLNIDSIVEALKDKNKMLKSIFKLKERVNNFNNNINLKKEIAYRRIIELGLELVDENGRCPLCEKPWDSKELAQFLKSRLLDSNKAQEEVESIKTDARNLKASVQKYRDYFTNLEFNYGHLKLETFKNEINKITDNYNDFIKKLEYPLENQISDDESVTALLISNYIEDLIVRIKDEVNSLKDEVSPEFEAWDILTKLEVHLGQYESYISEFIRAEKVFNLSRLILEHFENARNSILNDMFEKINSNFVNFYKELHGEDEKDFKSSLIPDEAKVVFEVDFYNKGMFHPGAVHSEGHQDSMGICLFLSINRFLAENRLNIIVLDDVVMSVDANHRRNFCKLIKSFPNTQFIITTHDRVWAKQLRSEGIVKSENMIEFKWWSIETGPTIGTNVNLWREIENDLNNNDVPLASWKLRRNGECFLNDVCDMFKAKIVFKGDGNWDFGDYLKASIEQYKKIISCAKSSASSWNDRDKLEEIKEIDKKFTDAVERTQYNQWAINTSIHFNHWADLQPNDFKPVVNAFNELFDLFICKNCGYIPQLILADMKWEIITCPCKKFLWNLKEKQ